MLRWKMRAPFLHRIALLVALGSTPASVWAEQKQEAEQKERGVSEALEGEAPKTSPEAAKLARARKHFETALEHYADGRYRQAIIELKRAHALDPSGKDLLYNLAVVHEKLGEVGPALSYYRQVHELEPEGPEKDRMAAIISRLEGAREELIRTRLGERRVLGEQPAGNATVPTQDAVFWTSAGVAAAALAVSAVFGARALAMRPGPSDGTGGERDVSDVRADARAAHRSAIVADVSLLVGLVSGSLAGVLYVGRERSATEDPRHSFVPPSSRAQALGFDVGIRF